MSVFKPGDRIRIILNKPYTQKEIREQGCHPDVDGKTGTIVDVNDYRSWKIKLDCKLPPHKLHRNYGWTEPFDEYIETEDALELL